MRPIPHVRWCGRAGGRNPAGPTRSRARPPHRVQAQSPPSAGSGRILLDPVLAVSAPAVSIEFRARNPVWETGHFNGVACREPAAPCQHVTRLTGKPPCPSCVPASNRHQAGLGLTHHSCISFDAACCKTQKPSFQIHSGRSKSFSSVRTGSGRVAHRTREVLPFPSRSSWWLNPFLFSVLKIISATLWFSQSTGRATTLRSKVRSLVWIRVRSVVQTTNNSRMPPSEFMARNARPSAASKHS